jgi:hypothetical protein
MAQNQQGQGGTQGQSQNQNRASGTTEGSSQDVRQSLRGAQFPASREDLRRQAEQNNADADVLVIIDALPDRRFDTIEAVIVAIEEANEPIGGERR